ncbi:MAG: hypothetical protein NT031_12180 [Planctomycetota bacterium]|nr:hypothetical protein [Planctomycetota bacterium]
MSTYRFLACAVIAVAAGLPAMGEDAPAGKDKKADKPVLKGEYAALAKVCDLSSEQQKKVQEALPAAEADATAQQAEYKKKLEAAQKALKDVQAQKPDHRAIVLGKVEEVLTPEQKGKYAGYRVYLATAGKYGRLKLSTEQKESLKTACLALGTDPEAKKKADEKALSLLSDEQKAKLAELSTPKEKRAPATRPAQAGAAH